MAVWDGRHSEPRKEKTKQEFQRANLYLLYSDLLATNGYCTGTATVIVVVVVVVVRHCRVRAGVRRQGARGDVPVSVSAPP